MINKYKRSALDRLKGNWGTDISYLSVYLILAVISDFLTADSNILLQFAVSFIVGIISLGYTKHVLDKFNGKEKSSLADIFIYFRTREIIPIIGLNIIITLFTLLWGLLFIIPGIVASLSYSYSLYIKMENPEIRALDAIKLSKEITNGHKWEIFLLNLSFIGWLLLGTITVIGLIPVTIYLIYTLTEQYKDLRKLYEGVK